MNDVWQQVRIFIPNYVIFMLSFQEATKLSISYLRTKTRYVISVKAMNTYHDSHLSSNVTVITSGTTLLQSFINISFDS